jgi:ABC-type antimicrobial peptide transport system permease subunit
MAERYWPGREPLGKRLQVNGRWVQVIGLARDSKYRTFLEPPKPFFYVPLRQAFSGQVMLHVRTRQAPETISTILAHEVHALDSNLAPSAVLTMEEHVARSTSAHRIAVTLLGVFGGLALLLAAVGLYGVMSYTVSQSTRELGLRMALGAATADLLRLVLRQGLALTFGGIALGTAASLGLTWLVADLLYKVTPRDIPSFAAALTIMFIASFGACVVPAWRACRTDPLHALRDS